MLIRQIQFLAFVAILNCHQRPTEAKPVRSSDTVVSDLLSALFRQTIYNRIENLLLDPGKRSMEKQRIIESAVDNYHRQQMQWPDLKEQEAQPDLTEMTGFWIRLPKDEQLEVEEPVLLASTQEGAATTTNENTYLSDKTEANHTKEDDYHTESYQLEDLFEETTNRMESN